MKSVKKHTRSLEDEFYVFVQLLNFINRTNAKYRGNYSIYKVQLRDFFLCLPSYFNK